MIKTGQSCGVVGAADRHALWHRRHRGAGGAARSGSRPAGRNRADVGGQVEIREGLAEGDIVVARAGALLREGDPVRPVTAARIRACSGDAHLRATANPEVDDRIPARADRDAG